MSTDLDRLGAPMPVDPWDQRPGEPDDAYRLFRAWVDLGPGRTLDDLSEALGRPKHVLAAYRRTWAWDARAEAHDQQRAWSLAERRRAARDLAAGRATSAALAALELAEGAVRAMTPEEVGARAAAELLSASTTAARWALGDPNAYTPTSASSDPLAAIATDAGVPLPERIRAASVLERRDAAELAAESDRDVIAAVLDALGDDDDRARAVAAALAGERVPEPGSDDDDRTDLATDLTEIMRGKE